MRILFASHTPIDDSLAGRFMRRGIERMRAVGHDVRALVVDGDPTRTETAHVRRILCHPTERAAPLHLTVPSFNVHRPGTVNFGQLNDRQLSDYRDVLRIEFDREIDLFDPHVVHTGQLWLFTHLALEAGTPYVSSTHGGEFEIAANDARYHRYVVEAAENAGRVLTHSDAAHAAVRQLVGDLEGRVRRLNLPDADDPGAAPLWRFLGDLYRETYVDRFGREPR